MKKNPALWLALLLSGAGFPASSGAAESLYEAAIEVADQRPDTRADALPGILGRVLVRVTGRREAQSDPALDVLRTRAAALMLGYGYERDATGEGLLLRVRFDPLAVDAVVRDAGLPVWGANRLTHLAWVALADDGRPRAVLDAEAARERAAGLVDAAAARGLPLRFPELGPSERQLAGFGAVWSGEYDGVIAASRGYDAEQLLVVRVDRQGSWWRARWTTIEGGEVEHRWDTRGTNVDEALAQGLHALADTQARRFAVQSLGYSQDLLVAVSGVDSFADYARLVNYLDALNPVRSVIVDAIEGDTISMRLRFEGAADTVQRLIRAGRVLADSPSAVPGPQQQYVLLR